MCLVQCCCYSCHLKVMLDRMVPSCLQLHHPDQRQLLAAAAAGAEARPHRTLAEMLYPPPSWEAEAAATTPSRRSSPKVCPVNLADHLFSDEEEEEEEADGDGGGYYYPAAGVNDQSVSMSFVSRASQRSVSSMSRRVSFRSPDESDVFIIPARRSHSDDDGEWSSDDGEPKAGRDVMHVNEGKVQA